MVGEQYDDPKFYVIKSPPSEKVGHYIFPCPEKALPAGSYLALAEYTHVRHETTIAGALLVEGQLKFWRSVLDLFIFKNKIKIKCIVGWLDATSSSGEP